MGNAIVFEDATITRLKVFIVVFCAFSVLIPVAPLFLLLPLLRRVKYQGILQSGALTAPYTRDFDAKRVQRRTPGAESLLGHPDIQSLASMGSSFETVRNRKVCRSISIPCLPWLCLCSRRSSW
jgi:hypothetical protein